MIFHSPVQYKLYKQFLHEIIGSTRKLFEPFREIMATIDFPPPKVKILCQNY